MTLTRERPRKVRRRLLPDPFLLTVLSFGTGFLDALTYLALDRIFGANMTGNLILVGIGIWDAPAHLLHPLVALLSFCLGSMGAGMCHRLLEKNAKGSPAPALLFLVTGTLLGLCAALAFLDTDAELGLLITALIGVGMGFQGLAARLLAVPEINTLVVTSTLSQLFAQVGAGRAWKSKGTAGRQVLAVMSMLVGAVGGAAVVPWTGLAGLAIPACLVLVMALFCRRLDSA